MDIGSIITITTPIQQAAAAAAAAAAESESSSASSSTKTLLHSALQTPKTPATADNSRARLNGDPGVTTIATPTIASKIPSTRSSVLCDSGAAAVTPAAAVAASDPFVSSICNSSNSSPTIIMPRQLQQPNSGGAAAADAASSTDSARQCRRAESDIVLGGGGGDEPPLESETKKISSASAPLAIVQPIDDDDGAEDDENDEREPLTPAVVAAQPASVAQPLLVAPPVSPASDLLVLSSATPTTSTPIGSCATHNSNTSSTDQTSSSSASLSTTNTTNTTATTADIASLVVPAMITPTQSTPNLLQCLSNGKTLNGDVDAEASRDEDDEARIAAGVGKHGASAEEADSVEHIKPLLSASMATGRKPTRGIVKSPSNRSFRDDPKGGASGGGSEAPRHVKFHHQNGGIPGTTARLGDLTPASSVGSTSSSSSCSSSSSSSSDDEGSSSGAYSEAQPPDGGWGWVVVFASFAINLIADGITFSFGVIYVEFLAYFGEGKGKTAWIGSLFMAMPLLSGPVASFLTDRYGCRKVTVAGSLLASLGFILSAFSTSMEMLFVTFGILAGFGLSLCYVAAVVIVAYYFDKRRSFATGLSVCGSGIGTFIFAPLTQVLIETYGWRGTTLILAGFFLNMTVCGMLMRDLEWTTHRAKLKAKQRKEHKRLGISADSFSVSNSTNTAASSAQPHEPRQPTVQELYDRAMDPATNPRLFSSLITLPTYLRNGERIPPEVLELFAAQREVAAPTTTTNNAPPTLSHARSFSDSLSASHQSNLAAMASPTAAPQPQEALLSREKTAQSRRVQNEEAFLAWIRRNKRGVGAGGHQSRLAAAANANTSAGLLACDSDPVSNALGTQCGRGAGDGSAVRHPTTAYLKDLKMHRHSLTYRGAMLNINRYRLRASSCPDIYRNSMTTIAKEKGQWGQTVQEFRTLIADMLDLSYFADIRFLLFALSNFFLYTWYDVPYVYLTDNAISLGLTDTDASMLISYIGIVNMFGEIFLGWCGDRKMVSAGVIYAICMGLCGIATAMVPLFKSYVGLSFVSGMFGLFIAANYALTSIILVELITLDRFTNAYGLLLLVQGIANLVGPPLAGWITDLTGNYDLAFYISGFFIAVSGGLMFILPVHGRVKKYQAARRSRTDACDAESNRIRERKGRAGGGGSSSSSDGTTATTTTTMRNRICGDCFGTATAASKRQDGENHV